MGTKPATKRKELFMDNKNRWAIYARRAGHKNVHPCAPSLGLYNCPLADLDRYPTKHAAEAVRAALADRKSTRLNSSHVSISYAVFCLKKRRRGRSRTRG